MIQLQTSRRRPGAAPEPIPNDNRRSVNDRLGFSLASDFVGCSAMSEPEERNLLGHESRRVKGAAAHLEVPAGIILPAKFTVTTHIGSGQSRFLRRCVEVWEFDAFVVSYQPTGGRAAAGSPRA